MSSHYLIKNATLASTGQVVCVEVDGERIAQVYTDGTVPVCENVIDAQGLLLFPGVIDDHVHFRDPGLTHKADMYTESCAAAAGGVTSYMEMPNTVPQTTTFQALDEKFEDAARKSVVNYSFFYGATNDNAAELPLLDVNHPDAEKNAAHVPGVKLFMGSSTGNMLVDKRDSLRQIFSNTPKNMVIMAHCEDMTIINKQTAEVKAKYGDDAPVELHPVIRNADACYASTALAVELAKETGARLHVAHVTTAQEAALFENKSLSDKKITAEVCIPHLVFTDADYSTLGTRIKCNPAVKSAQDRDTLRQGLTSGWIDVIGTDHAPHLLSEKQGGSLKAVSGMPMVQFSLVTMLELVRQQVLTYADVVRLMCQNPATLFGVAERGDIQPGFYADMVLVDPKKEWTLTATDIQSKCGWSPLENCTFSHQVVRTICNGHTVYLNGQVDSEYRGKPLDFKR